MATKSILKSINIKDRKSGSKLVNALESAKGKKTKDVIMSKAVITADDSLITKMFGDKK